MTAAFTALFDACVLYPAPLRDLLMWLALTDLFNAKWTDEIHDEWIRNVLAGRPDLKPEQLERTRQLMNTRIRDCLVTGYENLIERLTLPDQDDRHVLAAAILAGADVIVTFNLADFPPDVLSQFNIEARHPDDFVLGLMDLDEETVCAAVERQRAGLKNPPKSVDDHLETLRAQGLPKSGEIAGRLLWRAKLNSGKFDNQALAPRTDSVQIGQVLADPIENAIDQWAEASTRAETRERGERLRDKKHIIRSFLKYVGKHPGEVEPADVRAWRRHLESLKSENTIYSYLSRVSSFYEWLRKYPEIKDHIRNNPVSMARPTAPRPYQTEKTKAWTDEEMNAILDQIAAEAERGSIHALRDYAVTLFYLYSGLRRNEVFGLRGGDVELREGGLIVRYKRKGGKYQRREVAQEDVREALLAYLKKSKRLSVLHANDPLWTRHDRAGEPGLPLTSRPYANNLKKYAAKAGMRRVNVHQTRHTYARIVFEDSGDLIETQSALDHENQATTRVYVQTVAVKRDKHSGRIAGRIRRRKIESTEQSE